MTRLGELEKLSSSLQETVHDHSQQLSNTKKFDDLLQELTGKVEASDQNITELWSALEGYSIPSLSTSIEQALSRIDGIVDALESTDVHCEDIDKEVGILQRRFQEEKTAQNARLR